MNLFSWFFRKAPQPLTPADRRFLEKELWWLRSLDLQSRAAWERRLGAFLSRVEFEGCDGLTVTNDMRLLIGGQACLLALGREEKPFPKLQTILIYPTGFHAPVSDALGSNVTIERHEHRIGESWGRGEVILAWDEIDPRQRDPHSAGNLVFHEFAHQLDAENGDDEGVPVLPRAQQKQWQRVMAQAFRELKRRVSKGESPFLDPYGAESPAEFFAVATESFFEEGREMLDEHPNLYRILKSFYRLDSASFAT